MEDVIGKLIAVLVVIPLITMFLWNWLMPYLFGLPEIGFLQALGLMILMNGLFNYKQMGE